MTEPDAPRAAQLFPAVDEEVAAFWQGLGLPGLVDIHVHFMPHNVMEKVWAYFERGGPLTGPSWTIRYRWPEQDRLDHLRRLGVRAFPSLVYPHKPEMAEWLNDWAREFAATHDDVLSTATFFPEPSAAAYVDRAIEGGARLFKAHLQVGGYDPRHPWLDPVWGSLTDAGIPVVVHAGAGPRPGAFTGPGPFGEVLARHPRLVAVVAHMGWPDVDDFLDLADRYDEVRLDTTMSFVDVWGFEASLEESRRLAPRLAALRDKVLLGTDFPNIPYDYAHQLAVLARLDLGDDWLRAVCWENAVQLLRLDLPSVS